jgi:hypothetical protein
MLDGNEPQLLKFADFVIVRELDRHHGNGVAWWKVPGFSAIATKRHKCTTLVGYGAGHHFLFLHRLPPVTRCGPAKSGSDQDWRYVSSITILPGRTRQRWL